MLVMMSLHATTRAATHRLAGAGQDNTDTVATLYAKATDCHYDADVTTAIIIMTIVLLLLFAPSPPPPSPRTSFPDVATNLCPSASPAAATSPGCCTAINTDAATTTITKTMATVGKH